MAPFKRAYLHIFGIVSASMCCVLLFQNCGAEISSATLDSIRSTLLVKSNINSAGTYCTMNNSNFLPGQTSYVETRTPAITIPCTVGGATSRVIVTRLNVSCDGADGTVEQYGPSVIRNEDTAMSCVDYSASSCAGKPDGFKYYMTTASAQTEQVNCANGIYYSTQNPYIGSTAPNLATFYLRTYDQQVEKTCVGGVAQDTGNSQRIYQTDPARCTLNSECSPATITGSTAGVAWSYWVPVSGRLNQKITVRASNSGGVSEQNFVCYRTSANVRPVWRSY